MPSHIKKVKCTTSSFSLKQLNVFIKRVMFDDDMRRFTNNISDLSTHSIVSNRISSQIQCQFFLIYLNLSKNKL